MVDINKLTVGEAREIAEMFRFNYDMPRASSAAHEDVHWKIGAIYLIRTVTHIDTGRLVAVTRNELVLEEAAWIADTGRYADAILKAEFNEVEPYPDGQVIIGRGALIDAVQIGKTQRKQK